MPDIPSLCATKARLEEEGKMLLFAIRCHFAKGRLCSKGFRKQLRSLSEAQVLESAMHCSMRQGCRCGAQVRKSTGRNPRARTTAASMRCMKACCLAAAPLLVWKSLLLLCCWAHGRMQLLPGMQPQAAPQLQTLYKLIFLLD